MQRYLQRIERTTRLDIGLGLDQSDLRETEARLARLTRRRSVPAYTTLDIPALRLLERRVAVATRDRRIKVDINLDAARAQLARLRAAFAGIGGGGDTGGITFEDSGGITRHTKRLIALAAAVAAVIPAVLGLAGALAQASGALALLPALGLAGAASIGVLALAFTNLAEAGAEFQQLKRVIVGLKGSFVSLQQSVQQAFFRDLAEPIQALAEQYLPMLQRRLVGVADALNSAADAFIRFLAQPQTLADTALGFKNTEVAIRKATPGLVSFSEALRDISAVGATFLPGLATSFARVGARFAEFIEKKRETGELKQFFIDSIIAVESLGRSIGNLGSAFSGLIAANGGTAPFLANLELITAAIDRIINSPGGQAGFGALFAGISEGFAALFGDLGTFESLIDSIGPVLGEFFKQVGTVAGALLTALAPALEKLSPALTGVLTTVGEALAGALVVLTPAITTLADALGPFLTLLGEEFARVLEVLAPVIGTVATALGGAFLDVLSVLIPILGDLFIALSPVIEALGLAFADALIALAPLLLPIAQAFIDDLLPAILGIIPYLPGLVEGFIGLVEALIPLLPDLFELASAILGLTPLAVQILPGLVAILLAVTPLIQTVVGWLTDLVDWLRETYQRFYDLGVAIGNFKLQFALAVAHIKLKIQELIFSFALLVAGIRAKIDAAILTFVLLVSSIKTKISEAVETVRGLPGRIASALGNLGSLLVGAGKALIGGLIDGIKQRVGALLETMAGLAAKVAGFLPGSPVKTGALKAWNNGAAGKKLVELLASGVEGSTALDKALSSLTARVTVPNLDGNLAVGGISGGVGGGGASLHIGTLYARDDEAAANVLARRLGDAAAVYGLVGV